MPACRRESVVIRQSRRAWWCAVAVCVAAGAGCVVEERVWWAPGGSVAAVDGRPGLRLMKPDGTLSEPIIDGDVSGVSWLPDGSGLVVARAITVATWNEAKALLPAHEVEATETMARVVPSVIRAIADGSPSPNGLAHLAELLGADPTMANIWLDTLCACARDRHGDELQAALRSLMERLLDRTASEARPLPEEEFADVWRSVKEANVRVHDLSIVPVADGGSSAKVRSLLRSAHTTFSTPAVSPRGDWVAMTEHKAQVFDDRASPASLVALELNGEQRVEIADTICSNPVWLADGVSLAYVTAGSGDAGPTAIKTLARKTLVADGPDGMKAGDSTPLMVGVFPSTRLALLPGDRLLVPAVAMTLPMRPDADSPPRPRLFVVNAAPNSKTPPAAVNTAPDALPQDLGAFAVSPDGTRAAVVERRTDGVAVVDLATGRVEPVAASSGHKCGTLPAWRDDRELLIQTRRPPGNGQDTWAVWQRGKPLRWLDDTWTDKEKETLPKVGE
jgi:hypothetical protein